MSFSGVRWSKEEAKRLEELWLKLTTKQIIKILGEEFGHYRTIPALYSKADKLGLPTRFKMRSKGIGHSIYVERVLLRKIKDRAKASGLSINKTINAILAKEFADEGRD